MHELSLAKGLIAKILEVAKVHGACVVRSASLEVGELASVDADALSFAFEIVCAETIAEGCVVEISRIPLVVACDACGHEGVAELQALGCPACDAVPVRIVRGRELRLVAIDVD